MAMILTLGCKTIQNPVSKDSKDSNATSRNAGPHSLPMSMWSPEQRRAKAGYYYLAAESVALREQNISKAASLYEASYGLDPNPFLGGKMIAAQAASGASGAALIDARRMVLLYPLDAKLRFLLGEIKLSLGRQTEAQADLERCLQLDPKFEAAYLLLMQIYHQAGETPKAITVARDLTKIMPSSILGWSSLSRYLLIAGRYKDALIPARRAYEKQSSNPQLVQIYAMTLQLNGEKKAALRIYEQLYQMNPADEQLTRRMIDLYRDVGNLEDAIILLDEMISTADGVLPGASMQKALLLWELERFEEADAILANLLKRNSESDRLLYMNGISRERLGDTDSALKFYSRIRKSAAVKLGAEVRSILLLKNNGSLEKALAKTKKLHSEADAGPEIKELYASLLAENEQYEEAIEVVTAAFKIVPERHRFLFLKGVYQEKAGDVPAAMKTMRQVISLDSKNSSALNFLGYLYADRGENLDEAAELIEKALAIKPGDGFYLDSLGWVYHQKGQYEKADEYLRAALKAEPREGVIAEHLADNVKAKGRLSEAIVLYRQALQLDLSKLDRARILRKLKDLTNQE